MKTLPLFIAILSIFFLSSCNCNSSCAVEYDYKVVYPPAIIQTLRTETEEKKFKLWLKENRPEAYAVMYEKESKSSKETKSVLSALSAINSSIATSELSFIEYYIYLASKEGWQPVSFSTKGLMMKRVKK